MQEKTHVTRKKIAILYREENKEIIEKQCVKCKLWQPIDNFPNLKMSFCGKHNNCYNCEAERAEKLRRLNGIAVKQPKVFIQDKQTIRVCSKCKFDKPLADFDKNKSGYLEHDSECRECKRRRGELYRRDKGIRPQRKVPILIDELGNPTHRECSRCKKMLSLNQFNKHGGGTAYLGIHPYCKTCSAERELIRKYGLTLEDKARMYQKQNSSCAICQEPTNLKDIVVDHCHTTGIVRGLLCNHCNKALGLLKDKIELCMNMASYLSANQVVADKHTK